MDHSWWIIVDGALFAVGFCPVSYVMGRLWGLCFGAVPARNY